MNSTTTSNDHFYPCQFGAFCARFSAFVLPKSGIFATFYLALFLGQIIFSFINFLYEIPANILKVFVKREF